MRRWTDGPDGWMDGLQHVEYARMIVHIDFSQTAEAQRETLEAPDSKKYWQEIEHGREEGMSC